MLTLTPVSENALLCQHDAAPDLAAQRRWWALANAADRLPEVAESVVGMNNLTVFVHDNACAHALADALNALWTQAEASDFQGKHVDIPVHYGGACGEDLAAVAAHHGISPAEVVARHTAPVYTVFMMGFQPGFPYLGGLPEHLHTPRRAVPRTQVAAGSVGIGGSQTGVYPFASPGGWQIIGRTELPLFNAAAEPPVLLAAGDTVSFVAASLDI
ncbi:5-oxoprolinase subunit PxpB [Conchiformibius kuhniae]|uniref:5-oxoprolinase subunit PxpB n=1 Tax=Conchiformibius kuhniae TaxID=211502 RepID=A0A8T9MYZ9_9NEIS|nr:5-oxoprolinase subunit PxpB [Conchiformibius kuhniae]